MARRYVLAAIVISAGLACDGDDDGGADSGADAGPGTDAALDTGPTDTDSGPADTDSGPTDTDSGPSPDAGLDGGAGGVADFTREDVCRPQSGAGPIAVSPDGRWLAYCLCGGLGSGGAFVRNLASGATTAFGPEGGTPACGWDSTLRFSADSQHVAAQTDIGLVVRRSDGTGTETWLLSTDGIRSWRFTPDGAYVVAASPGSVRSAGTEGTPAPAEHFAGAGDVVGPSIVTAGSTRLVYLRSADGNYWIVDLATGAQSMAPFAAAQVGAITNVGATDTNILGVRAADNFLVSVDLGTGVLTPLSTDAVNPFGIDGESSPVFASGGDVYYQTSDRDRLWQAARDGSGSPAMLTSIAGWQVFMTPDGQRFFWLATRANQVRTMPVDGSTAPIDIVATAGVSAFRFSVRPDSMEIAVLTGAGGGSNDLSRAQVATPGGGSRVDGPRIDYNPAAFAFNGDGSAIVYIKWDGDTLLPNGLYAQASAGAPPTRVASDVGAMLAIPGAPEVIFFTDVTGLSDTAGTLHVGRP
jgi:hypothetical protein